VLCAAEHGQQEPSEWYGQACRHRLPVKITQASSRSDGGQSECERKLTVKEHQAALPEFVKYLPNGLR
jgi:hypothetical protein